MMQQFNQEIIQKSNQEMISVRAPLLIFYSLVAGALGVGIVSADQITPDSNTLTSAWELASESTVPLNNQTDLGEPAVLIAQASSEQSQSAATEPPSAKCLDFAQDINADLGEVLRANCQPTLGQMKKLMDNPVGNVAMFMSQVDYIQMENPVAGRTSYQSMYTGIFQFPKSINEDWNLINRVVFTVPSLPFDQGKVDTGYGSSQGLVLPPPDSGLLPIDLFDGRTTDFGDMYYVGFFSPKEGIKHASGATSVWGLGLDLAVPTAQEDILGTGKYSGGPSALYAYLGPKWVFAGLMQHYNSFAGDNDRADVKLTSIQYFWYYALDPTTSIGAGPTITANWEQNSENRWTVPVGIGINKTINIGKVPVRFGAEIHYPVIKPDDIVGSNWTIRFSMIPAVPAALFKWMQ
jgi:hypothetical protein